MINRFEALGHTWVYQDGPSQADPLGLPVLWHKESNTFFNVTEEITEQDKDILAHLLEYIERETDSPERAR